MTQPTISPFCWAEKPRYSVVPFDRTQQAMALIRQAMVLLGSGDSSIPAPTQAGRLLRRSEVEVITGLKKTAIYSRIKARTFPAAVEIGPGVMRWRESDIDAWAARQEKHHAS